MKLREVLDIALEAGEILLRNGAETYRVEESITRICSAYGHSCEAIVLPTGIFLTVYSSEYESETSVRRIKVRTLDLTKIDRINSFSRKIASVTLSYEEAKKELEEIKAVKYYPVPIQIISSTAVSFAYALLFGGSLTDGGIAFVTGGLLYLLNLFMVKAGYFPFLIYFVNGFSGGFISIISEFIIPGANAYIIIISSIIMFLPGVAITNGIRDLLASDTISGLTRLGEAFLTVLALGMGVWIGILTVHYII
ncbi:MAG: threonine/serine exporter family protein [Clostridiaceae bacterium]|nr:threonine/serine exporter family protein [Clostridiaceae bacterium]